MEFRGIKGLEFRQQWVQSHKNNNTGQQISYRQLLFILLTIHRLGLGLVWVLVYIPFWARTILMLWKLHLEWAEKHWQTNRITDLDYGGKHKHTEWWIIGYWFRKDRKYESLSFPKHKPSYFFSVFMGEYLVFKITSLFHEDLN